MAACGNTGLFVYEKINIGGLFDESVDVYLCIFSVVVGVGSTLAIILVLFGTIGFKIYRKIKYGISLYD